MLVYIVLPLTILYCLILSRILVKKTNSCTECYIARSNITLFIWAAILFGLAAFKGIRVGTDYPMYYYFFDDVAYEGRVELGISYIYQLAIINDSFLIFSSIIYFLIVTFLLLGIKKNCPNYLIGILFLVLTYVYFTSFNQLRQMLAVSLVFYGITLIISKKKNNKLKFIFIIAIALMFHNSAIFAFIFLLIPKVKYKPRIVIPLFLTTIALYFIPDVKNFIGLQVVKLSGVYAQKYANNLDYFFSINKEKGIIQLIPVLVQMIIVVISLYFPKEKKDISINNKLYNLSTNIVIINLCLYAFAGIEAIDRIQIYFSCFNIYYYSILTHLLLNDKTKSYSKLIVIMIIIFWSSYYILRLIINVSDIVPYSIFSDEV